MEVREWLPLAGNVAGIVVVVWFFLQHLAKKDEKAEEMIKTIITRVEKMESDNRDRVQEIADGFRDAVAESRTEAREMNGHLMALNRESVQTMGAISGGTGELRAEVKGLAAEVKGLANRIEAMDRPHQKRA